VYCWVFWSVEVPVKALAECGEFGVRSWDDSQNCQPERPSWNLMGMMCNPWFRIKVHKVSGQNEVWFEHPTRVEPNLSHYWDKENNTNKLHLEDGKLTSPGWMERQLKEIQAVYGPIAKEKEVVDPNEGWEVGVKKWMLKKDEASPEKSTEKPATSEGDGSCCFSGLRRLFSKA
jgi:hypothetical protein